MQGDWDIDKLADMNLDLGVDFNEMGFDSIDVDMMFDGDDRFSGLFENPEVDEEKNKLAEIKDARKDGKERLSERNSINWYSVLVFEDEQEKKEFYDKIGTPLHEEYINMKQLKRSIDLDE